ncbi:MAG: hypothetical protein DRJ40_06615 [Thermoprotei archaeon]|nr:MAG: hypothetical protein DRJ40_06615 [Thermoprotei archaeon]
MNIRVVVALSYLAILLIILYGGSAGISLENVASLLTSSLAPVLVTLVLTTLAIPALTLTGRVLGLGKRVSVLLGFAGLRPYFLSLMRHIIVIGATRTGKTTTVKRIVKQVRSKYRGCFVLVLDWHGEYSDLGLNYVTPEELRIELDKVPLEVLVEALSTALDLSDASLLLLYRALKRVETRSIDDVIRAVEMYEVTSRAEIEMKAAILRRLELLRDILTRTSSNATSFTNVLSTCQGLVLDLSNLSTLEEKRVYSTLILTLLYSHIIEQGFTSDIRYLVVIEEAQNLLPQRGEGVKRFSVIEHLVLETAKFGCRCILVMNTLPPPHIARHSTLIFTPMHVEILEQSPLRISQELVNLLQSLKVGEVLVVDVSGCSKVKVISEGSARPYRIVARKSREVSMEEKYEVHSHEEVNTVSEVPSEDIEVEI